MGMFDKYENNSYTAYNITPKKTSHRSERYMKSPLIGYDLFNNPREFIWDPEDRFSLNLALGTKVNVLQNSILFESTGVTPTANTCGVKGQYAYNTIDGRCWLCKGTVTENTTEDEWIPLNNIEPEKLPEWLPLTHKGIIKRVTTVPPDATNSSEAVNTYIWEESSVIVFMENGTKEITVYPAINNCTLRVTVSNFKHEMIYSYKFENSLKGSIQINKELTPLLVEGQFFIDTYAENDNNTFQQDTYNVTIVENPSKYRFKNDTLDKDRSVYTTQYTTQQLETSYIWEPLSNTGSNEDYVWIPISVNTRGRNV